MTDAIQKPTSLLASWFGNGPWRSRTVPVALLVTLVGVFFWISDVKKGAPGPSAIAPPTNSPAVSLTEPELNSPESEWDWSKPLPGYAKLSASYIVGCCVGWFFRRLSRLIFVVCAIAVALLALGRFAGVDTDTARDEVSKRSEWTQNTIEAAKTSIKFAVPSATGFGVGMFMGFRRRRLRFQK